MLFLFEYLQNSVRLEFISKYFAVTQLAGLYDDDSPLTVIFAPHFRLPVHSFLITGSQGSALSYAARLWFIVAIFCAT